MASDLMVGLNFSKKLLKAVLNFTVSRSCQERFSFRGSLCESKLPDWGVRMAFGKI
jgi:hypothetical protein